MSKIQAILFDINKYKYSDCIKWLLIHGFFKFNSYRVTNRFYRFRLIEPNESKYNYRVENLSTNGISFILQYPK